MSGRPNSEREVTTSRAPARPSLSGIASSLGFRRIQRVRIVLGSAAATAEATGVLHRYPRTVPISISAAGRLAAAGVPLRIDRTGADGSW